MSDDNQNMASSNREGDLVFTFADLMTDILENNVMDNQENLAEPFRFYYTLTHKLRNLLDAASGLIANIDGKPHYTDAVCLLLRTCLLDVVNIYYILDKAENEEKWKSRLERIMTDHVRSLHNAAKNDTVESLAIRERYPDCFNGLKFRSDILPVNISVMRNEIDSPALKNELKFIVHYYNVFSKIEHNGDLSFNLLHLPYDPVARIPVNKRIFGAIGTIMKAVLLLGRFVWVKEQDSRIDRMQDLMVEMLEKTYPDNNVHAKTEAAGE
jgi:hypothetical protein